MVIFPMLPTYLAGKLLKENVNPNFFNLDAMKITFDYESLKKQCIWLLSGDRMSWSELFNIKVELENGTRSLISNECELKCSTSEFDRTLYRLVHDSFIDMTPSMASRIEVWNFFNVGMLPELVVARWRKNNKVNVNDRFFSHIRNYLGTIWWRTYFFYEEDATDPYRILDSLKEDDFVQITERTRLRGYPDLALELGRKIADIRESTAVSDSIKETVIRESIMDLRIQALGLDFNFIPNIKEVVDETFNRIVSERQDELRKVGTAGFLANHQSKKE